MPNATRMRLVSSTEQDISKNEGEGLYVYLCDTYPKKESHTKRGLFLTAIFAKDRVSAQKKEVSPALHFVKRKSSDE